MASFTSDWSDIQPSEFHRLCSLCARIVQESQIISQCTVDTQFQINADLQENFPYCIGAEILVSAHKGCHLCSLFWSCLEGYKWDRRPSAPAVNDNTIYRNVKFQVLVERLDAAITITLACAEADKANIQFNHSVKGKSNLWRCIRMLWVMEANDQDPLCSPPFPWHSSSLTCSDAVMNLARQWLESCLLTHATCSVETPEDDNTPSMPSRLLDVKRDDGLVSLCISSLDISQDTKYLTLSHVWGDAEMFQLTKANFAELRHGISISRLPETFQDAVYMTKLLGYGFIWIDSLCIVQDSKEDWAKEAASMVSVYENAICTIAATQKDSHSGCFVNRNPLALRPCLLLPQHKLYAYPSSLFSTSKTDPSTAPISRRAWTLQERIRSRRILFLGTNELWWECSNLSAAEPYPEGIEHLNTGFCRPEAFFADSEEILRFREIIRGKAEVNNEYSATCWHQMVQEYTKRDLTYDSDKLIAMHGILQPFQRNSGLTLLGGLVKERMLLELSWYTLTVAPPFTDTSFPSWSWASVRGMIRFRASKLVEGFQRNAQLLEADPDPPLVALQAASLQKLTMLGFLKKACWTLKNKARRTQSEEVTVHNLGLMWFESLVIDPSQEIWLFLLGRGVLNDDDYNRYQVDFGLVLTKFTNSSFRRAGLFTGHEDQDLEVSHFFDEQDKRIVVIV